MPPTKYLTGRQVRALDTKLKESDLLARCKKHLDDLGYIYWTPRNTWGSRDIFTIFDVIAAKGTQTCFIQITTLRHLEDRKWKIRQFCEKNLVTFKNASIWAFDKALGDFVIYEL